MNELQIFDNPKFGKIRTVTENGKVLFCGNDVATALGYKNPSKALSDHCKGIEERRTNDSLGRQQNMKFIPEGDIYRLAAKSELPGADEFESWIFDEVLPTIRKTGGYNLPKDYPSALRALADETERHQQTEQDLKKSQNREREMAQLVAMTLVSADTRKANYYDELVAKNLLTSIRETANLLKVQEKEFIRWMIAGKFLYRGRRDKLRPYANRIEEGLFELKETSDDGTGRARVQTLVTPKGRETFLRLMDKGVFSVLYKPINIMDYIK